MDEYSELTEMVGVKAETEEELYKSFPQRHVRQESVYVRDAKVERYTEDACHWMLQCPAWEQLFLLEGGCECKGSQGQRHMKQAIFELDIACPNHIIVNNLSAMRYARLGV